jgi:hypothetical protein
MFHNFYFQGFHASHLTLEPIIYKFAQHATNLETPMDANVCLVTQSVTIYCY